MTEAAAAQADAPLKTSQVKVIAASSLGTIFEWYDFYLYGLLATVISAQFFSGVDETTGFIFALAAFAAGFAVRPFGGQGRHRKCAPQRRADALGKFDPPVAFDKQGQ